jgi:hypothetical protein
MSVGMPQPKHSMETHTPVIYRYKPKTEKPQDVPEFFTVQQVADVLNCGKDTVRRRFANRPGVVKDGNASRRLRGNRRYVTLRISRAALDAYIAERSKV